MLIAGISMGFYTMNFRQSAKRAQGVVTGNQVYTDSDGDTMYRPEVEFRTPDGEKHRFVSGTGSSPAAFHAGEHVTVVYREGAPDNAGIDTFFEQFFMPTLFSGLGLIFASVGGIPLYFQMKRKRFAEWVKANGQAIQADFTGAQLNGSLEINGQNPYRIFAQWKNPSTNQVHVFRSDNLWFDPTPYMPGVRTINVLIDPRNPKRHWVDTTFLPKLG
jgi:hypothetical protein